MPSSARFGFALEYTTDVPAARRFFTEVLGLQLERDHPTFVQFKDANGAAYAIASDQPMDTGDAAELWWVVDNAEQACAEMSQQAELAMPLRDMPFGKCFGIKDPAGQVHYLLEFAQQRPSQQVGS
jgi:catechol 2,3-dioxygenase-like lactoylglutathione lyase family enzyme